MLAVEPMLRRETALLEATLRWIAYIVLIAIIWFVAIGSYGAAAGGG